MHGDLLRNDIIKAKKLLICLLFGLICTACSQESDPENTPVAAGGPKRLFIIGQDLSAIRDYHASSCCLEPDGNTAYISLYNILSKEAVFSGLGIDEKGTPLDIEYDSGAGTGNVWKTATEFTGGLAIGLEMTENNHPDALNRLIAGQYDQHIAHLALFLKKINEPVWLRIGYEFDGVWNQGYQDAEKYKTAYRHVFDRLREAQVANVEYVWQSSTSPVDDLIDGRRENISKWYPGDDYVDWMGTSMFLGLDEKSAANPDSKTPSQRELTDEMLEFARQRGKPVMIAEASPQGYDLAAGFRANIAPIWDGPQKADLKELSDAEIWQQWYAPLFQYMNENADVIRALAYINVNWDAQARWGAPHAEGYWGDSRLQANAEIAKRFNQAMLEWRGR